MGSKAPDLGIVVLAVDDRPEKLQYVRAVLEPQGYAVRTASGVSDALASLRQHTPDLILSDVHMWDGTGYDLVAAVRADANLASIPIILISATRYDEVENARALAGVKKGDSLVLVGFLEPKALTEAVQTHARRPAT